MATINPIAELQEAAEKAARGLRNPDDMLRVAAEQDRAREMLRQRIGIVDLAVELVREVRDS